MVALKSSETCVGVTKTTKKLSMTKCLLSVCAHVNSFVPVESHYCRKSSKRLYLDSSLSVARMFNMYNEWPDLEKFLNKATTLRQYRNIVNNHFNLTFHSPKKDTCDQCHIFTNTENPSEQLITDHEKHLTNKTIARHLKNTDKTEANQIKWHHLSCDIRLSKGSYLSSWSNKRTLLQT